MENLVAPVFHYHRKENPPPNGRTSTETSFIVDPRLRDGLIAGSTRLDPGRKGRVEGKVVLQVSDQKLLMLLFMILVRERLRAPVTPEFRLIA